jgi:hypothetical protein
VLTASTSLLTIAINAETLQGTFSRRLQGPLGRWARAATTWLTAAAPSSRGQSCSSRSCLSARAGKRGRRLSPATTVQQATVVVVVLQVEPADPCDVPVSMADAERVTQPARLLVRETCTLNARVQRSDGTQNSGSQSRGAMCRDFQWLRISWYRC